MDGALHPQASAGTQRTIGKIIWCLGLLYLISFGLSLWIPFAVASDVGVISLPEAQGQPLNIVGVPGDTIELHLGEVRSDVLSGSDGFYVRLRHDESEFETTLPVAWAAGDKSDRGYRRIDGWLPVPDPPGHGVRMLRGTLWGHLRLAQDKTMNLEVPVNLRVVPRGEGVTSGQMERKRAWRIAWIVLGVQASVLLTSGAYLLLSPEARRGFAEENKRLNDS